MTKNEVERFCYRTKRSLEQVFQDAYFYRFKEIKLRWVNGALIEFQHKDIVPEYVRQYIEAHRR